MNSTLMIQSGLEAESVSASGSSHTGVGSIWVDIKGEGEDLFGFERRPLAGDAVINRLTRSACRLDAQFDPRAGYGINKFISGRGVCQDRMMARRAVGTGHFGIFISGGRGDL